MSDMLDRPVHPSECLDELGEKLEQGLSSAKTDSSRVELANRLLGGELQLRSRIEPRLKLLLDAVNGGRSNSAEIALKLSVSSRSFSRLWKAIVGMEARKFVQLMRFHAALEMIDDGGKLKQVAAECGYSDQAHMARQFKAMTGLPPSSLRRRLGNKAYRDLYASRPGAPWHRRRNQWD